MKILAFLQNQWFIPEQVETVRAIYARARARDDNGTHARTLNRFFLFRSCHTGKVLRAVFGEEVKGWHWENASPLIGDAPDALYPAEPEHMLRTIDAVKPGAILVFGAIARAGMEKISVSHYIDYTHSLVVGPHPASRGTAKHAEFARMRRELQSITNRAA